MANPENLKPITSASQAREMGKKGGRASVLAKRKRQTFAAMIDAALNSHIQPSHPKYAEIKKALRANGILATEGEEPTQQMLIIYGMIQTAQKKPEAAVFLRDSVGEKPIEKVENIHELPPPVVIGIHDQTFIASERARQEAEKTAQAAELEKAAPSVAPIPPSAPPPEIAANPAKAAETSAPTPQPSPEKPTATPTAAPTPAPKPEKKPMTAREAKEAMARKLAADSPFPAGRQEAHTQTPGFRPHRRDRTIF